MAFLTSRLKFKIAHGGVAVIIFALLVLFISNRLAFLISVLDDVFSPHPPIMEKIEIDQESLKKLEDKILIVPMSR